MAEKENLAPLVEEITEQLAYNNEKLIEALQWIGQEASPQGNDLNLTDALVGIARGLYAIADAINNRKPEAKAPVADVRPGDFRLRGILFLNWRKRSPKAPSCRFLMHARF